MSTLPSHNTNELAMASQHSHHHASPVPADLKRKRSPSHELHPACAPLPKTAKTHNHLQINYLARHLDQDLPLITNEDTLSNILSLLGDYQAVLDRHESMACNLGARPLGPILVKRFERLFDAPPRVLKSHGREEPTVSWLDVVEFARNKPEQFQLGQMSEGVRVCQFYTRQCRVQISEEDFVLISSGIPQKMIPPQPIIEDEEKELGTIEILEKNLGQICQLADQVAARTRQLNHRLKGRKQAILDRRVAASPASLVPRPSSPSNVALMNGANTPNMVHGQPQSSQHSPSSGGGFVAVNARQHHDSNGHGTGTSSSTRHELLSKFHTAGECRPSSHSINGAADLQRSSVAGHGAALHSPLPMNHAQRAQPKPHEAQIGARASHLADADPHAMLNSTVPIPSTPTSLLAANNQRTSQPHEKDDGGPFKAEMVHRMESLSKGERILPPCDRCRRLHMDCLKNLTACMGCTKKHAKCSWKEVRENELRSNFSFPAGTSSNLQSETSDHESGDCASTASPTTVPSPQRHNIPTSNSRQQQHTPTQPRKLFEPPSQLAQQQQLPSQPHYDIPHEGQMVQQRNSPPSREREDDKSVAPPPPEAPRSGLVHSTAKMSPAEGKAEYQSPGQPMLA